MRGCLRAVTGRPVGPARSGTAHHRLGPGAALGDELIQERLTNLPQDQALLEAARVVAARPPGCWDEGSSIISSHLDTPLPAVRQTLLPQVKEWNTDPRRAATKPLQGINDVKRRISAAGQIEPEQRWAVLAGRVDPRLLRQGDWPALAQLLQTVHDQGHDVAAITRSLVTATPLNDLPAQDLRYRLMAHLGPGGSLPEHPINTSTTKTTTPAESHRKAPPSPATARQAPSP
jgi:hypothetical protein